MGIYKNDYSKNEDETLWELHEIRHALHKEYENKTVEEINRELMGIYESWKVERNSGSKRTA